MKHYSQTSLNRSKIGMIDKNVSFTQMVRQKKLSDNKVMVENLNYKQTQEDFSHKKITWL